ncbi:MAG: DUF1772 domain-containing protein [Alteromonadaceae bacterium]|nr:DUF1772 domain-containing protein [Alteromonadaceae bacterium]
MTTLSLLPLIETVMQTSMLIMTGLYFVFSNTIMKSLIQHENGADVMVTINIVILNPLFMSLFIVSGLSAFYFVAFSNGAIRISGIVFFVGTTLVTIMKNVPLNNQLRDSIASSTRDETWQVYLSKWVFWNHIRSLSAITSGFLMVL